MTLPLTPPQTVGPFFADSLLRDDSRIVAAQRPGDRIRIEGRVVDGDGGPVPDAVVEIWHADADGRYHHPGDREPDVASVVGWGRSGTADGGYWFATVKPGRVRGPDATMQAPHLVMQVFARGLLDGLITRVYFADEVEANQADAVLAAVPAHRRQTLFARPGAQADPRTYRFDIVLQGDGETVFFDLGGRRAREWRRG